MPFRKKKGTQQHLLTTQHARTAPHLASTPASFTPARSLPPSHHRLLRPVLPPSGSDLTPASSYASSPLNHGIICIDLTCCHRQHSANRTKRTFALLRTTRTCYAYAATRSVALRRTSRSVNENMRMAWHFAIMDKLLGRRRWKNDL